MMYGECQYNPRRLHPWEPAPWWARLFGYTWRRGRERNRFRDEFITYEYRTDRQRAREALEETYGENAPTNAQQAHPNYIASRPKI